MTVGSSESDSTDIGGCSRAPESISLTPRGSDWAALVRRAPLTPLQSRVREQLGLPTDRPVIMSGHQAELWHPGILAKWFAGLALARRVDGIFVWLHVDQDTNEPGVIAVPALDAAGLLVRRVLTLVEPTKDVPTGMRGAARIDPSVVELPRGETLVDHDAVMRVVDALNRHASEPTLAMQFGKAMESCVNQLAGEDAAPVHMRTTSQLAATDAFTTLIDLLRHDPVGAIEAHNHAAAQAPDAGIRPLGVKRASSPEQLARVELPLWRVKSGAPRTPVMHSQLDSIPLAELRPRALLMTGLARLGACDLFIHGTGGGVYDTITEAWFEAWLGGAAVTSAMSAPRAPDLRDSLPLAPIAVATATARLSFDARHGGLNETDARKASHAAHHARHNPGQLHDEDAARAKRELVERIARSSDRAERAALFREMHELLDRVRGTAGSRLADLDRAAVDAKRRAAEQSVVSERAWPFALYPAATVRALRRRIELEVAE